MKYELKALTVRQPWANLISWGDKTIEVRSRRTSYRGDLLITASAKPEIEPFGCALCVVELVDVRPLTLADMPGACLDDSSLKAGLYAWVLRNPRRLVQPVPISGKLGLFDVEINMVVRRARTESPPRDGAQRMLPGTTEQ